MSKLNIVSEVEARNIRQQKSSVICCSISVFRVFLSAVYRMFRDRKKITLALCSLMRCCIEPNFSRSSTGYFSLSILKFTDDDVSREISLS